MRTFILIDGFNLYHSMMASPAFRGFRWLEFSALAKSLLTRNDDITGIQYFTAFYPGDPLRRIRHETYIEALTSVGVETVLGNFKRKLKRCKSCNQDYWGWEEKETDVNIAVAMFKHAALDDYDQVLVVSADSDLVSAIRTLKQLYPSRKVKIILPPNASGGKELKQVSDGHMKLNENHLSRSLFPDKIIHNGKVITKPARW